ncbi:hypothetical protein NB697_000770 [Xanthomonas sacchari]|nr:hypothetical protein [Xanthomonas sacchari]
MEAVGFARTHYKNLAGGIVAIHSATISEWSWDWGLKIRDSSARIAPLLRIPTPESPIPAFR